MSIQDKRTEMLTDIILKKNLQQGILPDSREFVWQLNQALRDTHYDEPSFSFSPYRNTEVVSSGRLNQDNEKIYDDLRILYTNMTAVHQVLNKHYQNFSLEKEKLEKKIDTLENALKQYIQNANRSGLLPYAYDVFDTTEKVDLEKTNRVFVDTANNAVHLVEEKNASARLIPENVATFKIYPERLDKKEELLTGNLANILTDNQDETWQKQILLKENLPVTGVLELTFNGIHNLNRIELEVFTIKPFRLNLTYTPDGATWYHLPYYETGFTVTKRVAIDFPSLDIKALRLSMQKSEADESLPETEDYDYQYLFGIQNLSFYSKQYATKGTLFSKCLDLENEPENYAINSVQLHADEWLPTGTDITYEIALPNPNGTLDWQRIDPMGRTNPNSSQVLYFSRMTKNNGQELFFPNEYAIRQSEAEDLLQNGIPLYRLSSIQNQKQAFALPKIKMLEGSTNLYVGKNTWEVTSFPSADVFASPLLNDFKKVNDGTVIDYLTLSSARSGEVFKNKTDSQTKKYLARIGFYLEEAKAIKSIPSSTEPIAIYSNGELLFAGETNVSQSIYYTFRPGWNEIVVLVNGKNTVSVNGMTVSLGFNPASLSNRIYSSSKPLKEISLFDLQYNTKVNDRTVFAKRETEKGLEILTNFGKPGLHFDLFYDYKEDGLPETEGMYIQAHFLRENGQNVPSPILRSYRLEFS